ncbi:MULTISPECIES: hypothetical protein [unclassified Sphingomonas]|uniref:hypothetical protein n=1 Tax=unclassified Sphingomonas TaxID=196159 RepID=UPI00226ACE9C|nr:MULTISPECIES: hypothetical protein [unclassified Sphingomonas]
MTANDERAERLAAQLRANLRRRKAQARDGGAGRPADAAVGLPAGSDPSGDDQIGDGSSR